MATEAGLVVFAALAAGCGSGGYPPCPKTTCPQVAVSTTLVVGTVEWSFGGSVATRVPLRSAGAAGATGTGACVLEGPRYDGAWDTIAMSATISCATPLGDLTMDLLGLGDPRDWPATAATRSGWIFLMSPPSTNVCTVRFADAFTLTVTYATGKPADRPRFVTEDWKRTAHIEASPGRRALQGSSGDCSEVTMRVSFDVTVSAAAWDAQPDAVCLCPG